MEPCIRIDCSYKQSNDRGGNVKSIIHQITDINLLHVHLRNTSIQIEKGFLRNIKKSSISRFNHLILISGCIGVVWRSWLLVDTVSMNFNDVARISISYKNYFACFSHIAVIFPSKPTNIRSSHHPVIILGVKLFHDFPMLKPMAHINCSRRRRGRAFRWSFKRGSLADPHRQGRLAATWMLRTRFLTRCANFQVNILSLAVTDLWDVITTSFDVDLGIYDIIAWSLHLLAICWRYRFDLNDARSLGGELYNSRP